MKEVISIDGTEVDVKAVYSISHDCRSEICNKKMCCCSRYEVCVNLKELQRITDYLPLAAKFATHLISKLGYKNIFDNIGKNLFAIDTNDEGLCELAYLTGDNKVLCSLHSVAFELNLPPHKLKPGSCLLWPLTITSDKPFYLSVDEDAFLFPCNKQRDIDGPLSPSIADIIKTAFGDSFLLELEERGL